MTQTFFGLFFLWRKENIALEPLIQFLYLFCPRKFGLRSRPRMIAQSFPIFRILEYGRDRGKDIAFLVGVYNESGLRMQYRFFNAAGSSGDHRQSGACRFQKNNTKPFFSPLKIEMIQ